MPFGPRGNKNIRNRLAKFQTLTSHPSHGCLCKLESMVDTDTQTHTQTTLHCHHIVPGGLHPPGTKNNRTQAHISIGEVVMSPPAQRICKPSLALPPSLLPSLLPSPSRYTFPYANTPASRSKCVPVKDDILVMLFRFWESVFLTEVFAVGQQSIFKFAER